MNLKNTAIRQHLAKRIVEMRQKQGMTFRAIENKLGIKLSTLEGAVAYRLYSEHVKKTAVAKR